MLPLPRLSAGVRQEETIPSIHACHHRHTPVNMAWEYVEVPASWHWVPGFVPGNCFHCSPERFNLDGTTPTEAALACLTTRIYAKASLHDISGAVESVPDLTARAPDPEALRIAGTDEGATQKRFPDD